MPEIKENTIYHKLIDYSLDTDSIRVGINRTTNQLVIDVHSFLLNGIEGGFGVGVESE